MPLDERFFQGWPLSLADSQSKGRYLLASRNISEGETVLVSEAYLSIILSSHKKRVCGYCYQDSKRRLENSCSSCRQTHYCSAACEVAHAASALSWEGAPAACPASQLTAPLEGLHLSGSRQCSSNGGGSGGAGSNLQQGACPAAEPGAALESEEASCRSSYRFMDSWRFSACAPRSSALIPHSLLCGVLRQFCSVKWTADVESVLLGVLQLLALEHLEGQHAQQAQHAQQQAQRAQQQVLEHTACQAPPLEQPALCRGQLEGGSSPPPSTQPSDTAANATEAAEAAALAGPPMPRLGHADFLSLCSHSSEWDPQDRTDFLKCASQLVGMMRKAAWPGELPSPELVLEHAGRITSNNFGIYSQSEGKAGPRPGGQGAEGVQGEVVTGITVGCWVDGCGGQGSRTAATLECSLAPAGAGSAGTASQTRVAGDICLLRPLPLKQKQDGIQHQQQQGQQEQQGEKTGAKEARQGQADVWQGNAGVKAQLQGEVGPKEARQELVGREVYITASFFNHSCQPNCMVRRGFKAATVVALRDIKAGEEVTISYADLDQPRAARRSQLKKYFHFDCDCPRCEREAIEGSARCSYTASKGKTSAPKRRGRKARVSR